MTVSNPTTPPDPVEEPGGVPRLQLFLEDARSSEEPLLPRVARGETDAVRGCIDRYGGLVWSMARRFLGDAGEAEDVTQEIFVDLWRASAKFDPAHAAEKTFVGVVARRRLIDRIRKISRRPALQSLPETLISEPNESRIETDEQTSRVLEAMARLGEEPRRILKMALLMGHTHEEVAAATGLPLGTVKSHLRRGLMRVREILDTTLRPKGGN